VVGFRGYFESTGKFNRAEAAAIRLELHMTRIELNAIPKPLAQGAKKPLTARGIQTAL
jgi:hypothetical protein